MDKLTERGQIIITFVAFNINVILHARETNYS